MNLTYINENVKEVIQNMDKVLFLRKYKVGKNFALFAVVREDPGVYRRIQLSKPMSDWVYPYDALYYFFDGPGYFYDDKFMFFHDANWGFNAQKVEGFGYMNLENYKINNVGVYAKFFDGSATRIIRKTPRNFKKTGGVQPYINILKQYKECEENSVLIDPCKIISWDDKDDDTLVIPSLHEKTVEEPMVRKRTL